MDFAQESFNRTRLLDTIKRGNFFVIKTDNIYDNDFEFNNCSRINSFYSENRKMYTWQKKSYGSLYIYGNPFGQYDF